MFHKCLIFKIVILKDLLFAHSRNTHWANDSSVPSRREDAFLPLKSEG
jgi:hypothetical protein